MISGDLKQPDLPQQIFENLGREGIHVDILVSNAGFGFRGKWWEIPIEQDLATIRLNIEAVLRLTKLFLPPMVKLGRGRLLNTASVAGFEPGPCSPSIMPPRLSSFPGAKRSPSSWRHSRIGHRAVPRTYGH